MKMSNVVIYLIHLMFLGYSHIKVVIMYWANSLNKGSMKCT